MPARRLCEVPAEYVLAQAQLERPVPLKGRVEPNPQFAKPHGIDFQRCPELVATRRWLSPCHAPNPRAGSPRHDLLGRPEALDLPTC